MPKESEREHRYVVQMKKKKKETKKSKIDKYNREMNVKENSSNKNLLKEAVSKESESQSHISWHRESSKQQQKRSDKSFLYCVI